MKKEENDHPVLKHKWNLGQRAADKLTGFAGSWTFIISFMMFIIIWMSINVYVLVRYEVGKPWDPYPFILLNLILSCLAAIQAPIILMSQNREAQKDRLRSIYDYEVNRKAEREIRDMQGDLHEIKRMIKNN